MQGVLPAPAGTQKPAGHELDETSTDESINKHKEVIGL